MVLSTTHAAQAHASAKLDVIREYERLNGSAKEDGNRIVIERVSSDDDDEKTMLRNSFQLEEQAAHPPSEPSKMEAQPKRKKIPAFVIIPSSSTVLVGTPLTDQLVVWTVDIQISLSIGVVLFNKHIFSDRGFPYPLFLTCFHMLVATIGTNLLKVVPLPGVTVKSPSMSWSVWFRTVLPLSIFFSGSLVLSNLAYVHLSVSFVQMLKSSILILTLIIQLLTKLQAYSHLQFAIIIVISVGCYIAASGEVKFDMFGFVCQCCAVVVEAARLVLVEIMLKNHKMDPLSSIAMYAPVCMVLIAIAQPFMEGSTPFHLLHRLGFWTFAFNGLMAFSLNFASVFLIESAGSVVLSLSGVVKDILLIGASMWLLGSSVTSSQILGYVIALVGLLIFRITGGSLDSPVGSKLAQASRNFSERVSNMSVMTKRTSQRVMLGGVVGFTTVAVSLYLYNNPYNPYDM
ncbi:hypothetical protein IAR55_005678 [Kwoniella newhampshirensis]|uniref:Sugar phosphate transporter domain-containing protein n=1 Tax=Kwoniella newhampshirensis TaxID=1651941 RepID=A0AAW0YGI4_9TREE